MLTDEELTTRLRVAFHETATDLSYAGRVPRVRRTGGLAATSALAAAAALALAPAALERDQVSRPQAVPSTRPTATPGHQAVRTLRLGNLRFVYASADGIRGRLYFVLGPDFGVPPDAEKADIDAAGGADVWFAKDPGQGDPQVYVKAKGSSMVYGIFGEGWSREQLTFLLQHPVAAERGQD